MLDALIVALCAAAVLVRLSPGARAGFIGAGLVGVLLFSPIINAQSFRPTSSGGGTMSAAEILAALITVDTDSSGLNANTLQGVAKTGYCQLAGNGLCNATGTMTFDNADGTADINSASGDKLHFASVGAAPIVLQSGSDTIQFGIAAAAERMFLFIEVGESWIISSTNNAMARIGASTGGHFFFGKTGDVGATALVAAASDQASTAGGEANAINDGVEIIGFYGGGHMATMLRQSVACAAGVLALDPTSSVVNIDGNGAACVVTLSETSAVLGSTVTINITAASGGGGVTFPDVANVAVNDLVCDTTGLQLDGVAVCRYVDAANDHYVCKCQAA